MDPRMTQALQQAGIAYREGEPLSRHTTMGVGGEAAVMAFPRSSEQLRATLQIRADLQAPHRVLGGGSNLVVVDEGLDELVVNTESMRAVTLGEDGSVTAEGGANLIRTVVQTTRAGWRGLESAVGIPGSIGGAAVMNAGAYGFSISDVLHEITVYDENGHATEPPEGWRFRYRGSSIPEGAAVASLTVGWSRETPRTSPGRPAPSRTGGGRPSPVAATRAASSRTRRRATRAGQSTSWASRACAGAGRW
jgi:UDP-N-acetylmuramate dehydrogenase